MTPETAGKVADALLATALLGVAVVVIRTPSLRRIAWGLAVTALSTSVPAWLKQEVQQAWTASAPGPR